MSVPKCRRADVGVCTFELFFGEIGSIVEIEEVGVERRGFWFVAWIVVGLQVGMRRGQTIRYEEENREQKGRDAER